MLVQPYTRAGKKGKIISCPECKLKQRVYAFNWKWRNCKRCGKSIYKLCWKIEKNAEYLF